MRTCTHASHSSSFSTWASVVTFWLEVCKSVGRGREGKGLLLEPSLAAALCLQERLCVEAVCAASVWPRNTLKQCTWGTAPASCVEKFPLKIFFKQRLILISCDSRFVSSVCYVWLFFIHCFLSLPLSLFLLSLSAALLQERSSTTWLHMEEWRKKRPGLNLDRYPAFSPLQCSGFTPLLLALPHTVHRPLSCSGTRV